MRFSNLLAIGLLTFTMATAAHAQSTEQAPPTPTAKTDNGSTNCPQRFSCSSTDSGQMASLADTCVIQGFGISAQQGGIFNTAILDANNCMDGALTSSSNSTHTMSAQCCEIADGDTCKLRCSLLVY
jgi:hypothetical protein